MRADGVDLAACEFGGYSAAVVTRVKGTPPRVLLEQVNPAYDPPRECCRFAGWWRSGYDEAQLRRLNGSRESPELALWDRQARKPV
jgi:hypothetical protein